MFNKCFAEPAWAGEGSPSLRIQRLINKTDEHINVKLIANRILNAMIGTSPLRVLESVGPDESGHATDFHLVLEITSVATRTEELLDKTYSVTARVTRVADTEIVCQATAQRRKLTTTPQTAW